jgi:DNA-binding response OmpR family regulator
MKRILIIEDEQKIAELERDYLEMEGFEVVIENDGHQGLERALKESFDLLILDLMLPGIDGFNICRNIRQEKDLSIIMVTAKGENIDKIRGLGLGADDYMTKPFHPQELVARVKTHIRRYDLLTSKANQVVNEINIGHLRIEIDARRVYVRDEEVVFTTKEFDTLLLLAENPNIVFEKSTIFERIWGLDSLGDLATVAVHIRRIREKIESDPANPEYIETVWGAGYRFKKI